MTKIKDILMKHKKMCTGLAILAVMGIICFCIGFVLEVFRLPAFYIGAFLAICTVGSILWLIGQIFTKKWSVWWYIIALNTLVTVYSMYHIIYDTYIYTGWLHGLVALMFMIFVIPVVVAIYIFCIVNILKNKRKSGSIQK